MWLLQNGGSPRVGAGKSGAGETGGTGGVASGGDGDSSDEEVSAAATVPPHMLLSVECKVGARADIAAVVEIKDDGISMKRLKGILQTLLDDPSLSPSDSNNVSTSGSSHGFLVSDAEAALGRLKSVSSRHEAKHILFRMRSVSLLEPVMDTYGDVDFERLSFPRWAQTANGNLLAHTWHQLGMTEIVKYSKRPHFVASVPWTCPVVASHQLDNCFWDATFRVSLWETTVSVDDKEGTSGDIHSKGVILSRLVGRAELDAAQLLARSAVTVPFDSALADFLVRPGADEPNKQRRNSKEVTFRARLLADERPLFLRGLLGRRSAISMQQPNTAAVAAAEVMPVDVHYIWFAANQGSSTASLNKKMSDKGNQFDVVARSIAYPGTLFSQMVLQVLILSL